MSRTLVKGVLNCRAEVSANTQPPLLLVCAHTTQESIHMRRLICDEGIKSSVAFRTASHAQHQLGGPTPSEPENNNVKCKELTARNAAIPIHVQKCYGRPADLAATPMWDCIFLATGDGGGIFVLFVSTSRKTEKHQRRPGQKKTARSRHKRPITKTPLGVSLCDRH